MAAPTTTIKFLDHWNEEIQRYQEVELPAKFIVCDDCKGVGKSSAYLGAFTRDDLDELGDEFIDDYRAGNFDRPCETCKGERVVAVVDESLCDLTLLAEYKKCEEDNAIARMEAAAESLYFARVAGDWS